MAASISYRGTRVTLGAEAPTIVPAEYLLVEIEGSSVPAHVQLDGRRVPLALGADRTRGTFLFDAFRSVGFHRLTVGGESFLFGTEDGKLQLDGIMKLLDYLGSSGLGWNSQMVFSDGTQHRHDKVDYAFLDSAVPKLLEAADSIVNNPRRNRSSSLSMERPGAARIHSSATRALIRRSPKTVLERSPSGNIVGADGRFSLRRVIAERRKETLDTLSNRRLKTVLGDCLRMASSLSMSPEISTAAKAVVNGWAHQLESALRRSLFSRIREAPESLPDRSQPEEQVDDRYRTSFDLWKRLRQYMGWNPSRTRADRYAFVMYADEIYQAFVACCVAKALGAKPTRATLVGGRSEPAFQSDSIDIYYDAEPPSPEFMNWRSKSTRPTAMRPDVTIVNRALKRAVLLDAKYRRDGDRAPSSAIEECQVYLQSFQKRAIAVAYPGPRPRIEAVTDGTHKVLELSLAPFEELDTYLQGAVAPSLAAIMEPI